MTSRSHIEDEKLIEGQAVAAEKDEKYECPVCLNNCPCSRCKRHLEDDDTMSDIEAVIGTPTTSRTLYIEERAKLELAAAGRLAQRQIQSLEVRRPLSTLFERLTVISE